MVPVLVPVPVMVMVLVPVMVPVLVMVPVPVMVMVPVLVPVMVMVPVLVPVMVPVLVMVPVPVPVMVPVLVPVMVMVPVMVTAPATADKQAGASRLKRLKAPTTSPVKCQGPSHQQLMQAGNRNSSPGTKKQTTSMSADVMVRRNAAGFTLVCVGSGVLGRHQPNSLAV